MIKTSTKKAAFKRLFLFDSQSVGVAGFEPATPCSQSRCANRTALYPEISAERGGFEPPVQLPVRQFSKLVVSATHPSLLHKKQRQNLVFLWMQMYQLFLHWQNLFKDC